MNTTAHHILFVSKVSVMFKTLSRDWFLIVIITPITLVNKILTFFLFHELH